MSNTNDSADLTISGEEFLIKLINTNNKTNFTVSDVIIGSPVSSPDQKYNTDIEVTFQVPAQAGGDEPEPVTGELHYERFDLGRLFSSRELEFEDENFSTVSSLLPKISEEARISFDHTDLVEEPISGTTYPKTVLIRATKESLRFIGQFSVSIIAPRVDDPSVVQPVTQTVNATPSYLARKSDGSLWHGTGNPASGLMGASNGEVEVLGGARYYKNPIVIQPVDGVYHLNIGDTSDWNFPLSFGLINTKNAKRLTDLYRCTLKVTSVETNAYLEFELKRDYGRLKMFDAANNLVIDDLTAYNKDQTLYQDIQRLIFYRHKLGSSLTVNALDAPYGTFKFELKAQRKEGSFPPVEVTFTAEVKGPTP